MKFTPVFSAIVLSLQFSNSLAADSSVSCQPVSGTLQQLLPDDSCTVYTAQKKYFPDLTFLTLASPSPLPILFPPYCYSGTFVGQLGTTATINGTVFSGLTENNFNLLEALTAASVININAVDAIDGKIKELGTLYTNDSISSPVFMTTERLTMIAGSKIFKDAQGYIDISGNAIAGPTSFTGTLCPAK
ncbi:conserved exported hypothetical protein [Candidatus Methylobacter favarea]|uniref:Uncharacterized protein n=1 Tax=Candidatus Methylobacter favarea TaxID=2707345 RepID=A0A8S0YA71_9GAMM|nr:hypothetical protein [Candidatus Methylobacter favarea]CAA9891221.1 conserved exported hypothetical protein [Candidatus Methylobacter favarea]